MKKFILLLALFSLGASAQHNGERLYLAYKKEGDKAFREGQFSKAAAQYQSAKRACTDCKGIDALIDSCATRQRLASAKQLNEPAKPKTAPAPKKEVHADQGQALSAEMGALAPHGQLTQFSNMDYNFVSSRVQKYLSQALNMYPDSDDVTSERVFVAFKEKSALNAPQKALQFNFNVHPAGTGFLVNDCRITGDRDKLIKFYVNYWPTTVQIDETNTGIVATTRLLADDVLLYLNGKDSYIAVKARTAQ